MNVFWLKSISISNEISGTLIRALFVTGLFLFQTECDVLIPLYPEKCSKMPQIPTRQELGGVLNSDTLIWIFAISIRGCAKAES